MIRLQELELVFGQTNKRTDGRWTHRHDVGNSILDESNCEPTKIGKIFRKKSFLIMTKIENVVR